MPSLSNIMLARWRRKKWSGEDSFQNANLLERRGIAHYEATKKLATMNRQNAAIALGRAVEAAARLTFAEAKSLLESGETLFGSIDAVSDIDSVVWRVEPIQEIVENGHPSIEITIRAYDAYNEMRVYLYASDHFPSMN